jgi:hypothetical protein
MSDRDIPDISPWERFFGFVLPDPRSISRAAVQAELHERGINVSRAVSRVMRDLAATRAREDLAVARAKRLRLVTDLREIKSVATESVREQLRQMIGRLSATPQTVYYRKLEQAATDEDLRALEEDIRRLERLGDG